MSEKSKNGKHPSVYNRNFLLLLYPDNAEHMQALEYIKSMCDDFAFVLHNKDEFLESQDIKCLEVDELLDNHILKKEHYHVVLKFQNKRYKSAIAKEFGIEEKFIRTCNLDGSLLYLVHFDDEDKYQYSVDDVHGTLKLRLQKLIANRGKDEDTKVLDLLDHIDATTTTISISYFSRYCASNGMWDVYRRGASIFNACIFEHNQLFSSE